jgi:hypothetical protein
MTAYIHYNICLTKSVSTETFEQENQQNSLSFTETEK